MGQQEGLGKTWLVAPTLRWAQLLGGGGWDFLFPSTASGAVSDLPPAVGNCRLSPHPLRFLHLSLLSCRGRITVQGAAPPSTQPPCNQTPSHPDPLAEPHPPPALRTTTTPPSPTPPAPELPQIPTLLSSNNLKLDLRPTLPASGSPH